ncbi:hypothetical protein RJ640_029241 [Escallonia rubra]|uniref:BHLH domain-containing protein n=1 Tax=Escallonia rubra TaxID=112253 RepID=A0AA88QMJ6_9ASTE|nr:hypothetical protein RJ640_029241 [Escallonia rubra]
MEGGQCSSTAKTERKVVEKNRRNHMKTLYSQLCSLLPDHASKEGLPLPDQVDEAIEYIKSLGKKLERNKDKKEKLLRTRKRMHECINTETTPSSKSPQFEIHEMGPDLNVVSIIGLDNQLTFCEILRVLFEEGMEVLQASFSTFGNSVFHVAYEKVGESNYNYGAGVISKRLKELIHGSSSTDLEAQVDLWDFEIQPDLLEFFGVAEVMPMGVLG